MSPLRQTFAPLANRNLSTYLGGQLVSLVGTWMQFTAQSWVVWELSHSTAANGIAAALATLPTLLLGPVAGVIADRFDRRRILLLSQSVAAVLAAALAVLVQTGLIELWHVYVLATLLGIVAAIDFPTQQAFIGDLSGIGQVRQAVVLNNMIFQASRMVGPAIAGYVVARIGAAMAFGVNSLSFLAVIASLVVIRATQVRTSGAQSAARQFVDGLRFIAAQPRIQDLIGFTVLVAFFGISLASVVPAFVAQALRGQADSFGLLMGASGAGALVGAVLVVPATQQVRRAGVTLALATGWAGLWLVALSLSRSLPVAAAGIFLSSIAFPVVFTMSTGLLQVLAPPDMRARLLSTSLMVSFGAQPVAALFVGFVAQAIGAPGAVLLNGLLMTAGALALFAARPGLRAWEVEAPSAPSREPSAERPALREAVEA